MSSRRRCGEAASSRFADPIGHRPPDHSSDQRGPPLPSTPTTIHSAPPPGWPRSLTPEPDLSAMPRVLICDKLEAAGLAILQAAGIDVDNRPGLKGQDLIAALQQAD